MIDHLPTPLELEQQTILEYVPIAKMFVDPSYGRELEVPYLNRLLKEWDERALGVIYLSYRDDGRLAIIDGQHRVAAATRKNLVDMAARVYLDLTLQDEARLYRLFAVRRGQTPLVKYHAALTEGQTQARQIQQVLNSLDLTASNYNGPKRVRAIGALTSVITRYDVDMLDLTMRTLYTSFGDHSTAFAAEFVSGMAAFIVRYEEKATWTRLVERLRKAGPEEMMRRYVAMKQAMGMNSHNSGGTSGGMMARVFKAVYDNGLPEDKRLPDFIDHVGPGSSRKRIIDPEIRLAQRKALSKSR
jgi:hypothetical protein